jgi:hypothetical protein
VLAERAQIDVDAAFRQLRDYARERNRRLSEIARAVIEGELDTASRDSAPRIADPGQQPVERSSPGAAPHVSATGYHEDASL